MQNRKVKIVAIDDNADNLFTLKVLIKEKFPNAIVLTALSGEEGLEIAVIEEPHLILLDIRMPEMDGFEVCEKLKANKKTCDIPVVFVTALGAKEDRIKALNFGGEGFLSKPVDESELTAQVRAMLKIREATIQKINENERLEVLVTERTKELKKEFFIRKQAEDALSESEGLSHSITQSATDAIICLNSEGIIRSWNTASEKIFGYTSSEMINKKAQKIIPERYFNKHENGLERLKRGSKLVLLGKTIEIVALRSDGTEFPIELSLSSWNGLGNEKHYTGIIRDITEKKRVENTDSFRRLVFEKLAKGDSLGELLDFIAKSVKKENANALCSILLLDESKTYFTIGAAPNLPKFYTDAIEGLKIGNGVGSCGTAVFLKKRVIVEDIQTYPNYSSFFKEQAKKENIQSSWSEPIINNKGEVLGTFAIYYSDINFPPVSDLVRIKELINITTIAIERKFSEQKLMKAKNKAEESNALKTEFLNNMSHEIRTPMNGILGFSELLIDSNLTDEKRKSFVSIIQSSGKQLLHIIDDILEISRLETKQVKLINEDVCLNNVLYELFSVFDVKAKENKTPLYLKNGLSDRQSTINIDISKLTKILSNLLENSLKFTNKGFIELGYNLKNEELELYVKDTGIGIDNKNHELIFERFSQAEKDLSKNVGGLGLGLSIVKESVELIGGSIIVKSKKGNGATFFVTIPYNPVYDNCIGEDTEKGQTILIVDDEEVNYLYLETLLNEKIKTNCQILHAKNGKEAVDFCTANAAIDFVFMDLKMPVMDGYIASKLIKELRPDLNIVAQTAYSSSKDQEKAIEAGCDDCISKPISVNTFKKMIDKYL